MYNRRLPFYDPGGNGLVLFHDASLDSRRTSRQLPSLPSSTVAQGNWNGLGVRHADLWRGSFLC